MTEHPHANRQNLSTTSAVWTHDMSRPNFHTAVDEALLAPSIPPWPRACSVEPVEVDCRPRWTSSAPAKFLLTSPAMDSSVSLETWLSSGAAEPEAPQPGASGMRALQTAGGGVDDG